VNDEAPGLVWAGAAVLDVIDEDLRWVLIVLQGSYCSLVFAFLVSVD
jgi:hypothetical protein